MAISDDADGVFPRFPRGKLLQVSVRPKLVVIAERLEQRYGSPRATFAQPESILERAASKLAQSGGSLALLTHRERKASVELCWLAREGWQPNRAFVSEWLRWAEFNWNSRVGTSRIAVSYIRNYDVESEATALIGKWLAPRNGEIGGNFGNVFRHYSLDDGRVATLRIAKSLASDSAEFFARIDSDTKSSAVFQGSGILVALLAEYGARCSDGAVRDVASTTKLLTEHFGGGWNWHKRFAALA